MFYDSGICLQIALTGHIISSVGLFSISFSYSLKFDAFNNVSITFNCGCKLEAPPSTHTHTPSLPSVVQHATAPACWQRGAGWMRESKWWKRRVSSFWSQTSWQGNKTPNLLLLLFIWLKIMWALISLNINCHGYFYNLNMTALLK